MSSAAGSQRTRSKTPKKSRVKKPSNEYSLLLLNRRSSLAAKFACALAQEEFISSKKLGMCEVIVPEPDEALVKMHLQESTLYPRCISMKASAGIFIFDLSEKFEKSLE